VLLTAGLRRGDALGLQWSDLELEAVSRGTLHVRHQLQWPKGVPTIVPVKTRKGVRTIPLPRMTVEVLLERRALQATERTLVGDPNWRAGELVFSSEEGAPLYHNTITKQFHVHLRNAGLKSQGGKPWDRSEVPGIGNNDASSNRGERGLTSCSRRANWPLNALWT
jgi:integrase